MASKCFDHLWRSELCNNMTAKDRLKGTCFNQMKFTISETYKKMRRQPQTFNLLMMTIR